MRHGRLAWNKFKYGAFHNVEILLDLFQERACDTQDEVVSSCGEIL